MTMADLSKVRVRALVDEIDVGKVEIGQKVSIKVAAYRDKEFIGTVSKIEPKAYVQQNVTTFPVLIDIDNEDGNFVIPVGASMIINIPESEFAQSAYQSTTRAAIESLGELLSEISRLRETCDLAGKG